MLRRAQTWTIQSQAQVQFGSDFDGNAPWFMQLGPGRFVIVTTTNSASSRLTTVTVDESNLGAIGVDRQVEAKIAVNAAGVVDVDGDGTPELVVGGNIGGFDQLCPTASLAVFKTDERLGLRSQADLRTADGANLAYFTGAALGQWDARPGTDLLMQAYECAPDGSSFDHHHLLGIRLADLSIIRDLPTSEADSNVAQPLPNAPVVVDVDRDGRNEAVVATSVGMRVIDPSDNWRITPFATDTSALIGAVDRSGLGPGASLVEIRSTGDPATSGVAVTRLTRVKGRVRIDAGAISPTDWASRDELDASVADLRNGSWVEQPPVMTGDVDGDGCTDLLASLVLIGCPGAGALEQAPAWIATRPIALLGQGEDRTLLVADDLNWYPAGGALDPSPLAAHSPGSWRMSVGTSFTLAEVPVGRGGGPTFPAHAVPVPAIERAATQDGSVDVRRPTGTRLLVRVIPSGGPVNIIRNATEVATPTGFLYSNVVDHEVAGPGASLAGSPSTSGAGSLAAVEHLLLLPNVQNQDGAVANQWTITVAALDASGTLSTPVQAVAALDRDAPPLKLEAPTFSAPWPFTATVHGTSEGGSTVSLTTAAGSPVVVAADGTYELPVQLTPWPQDVGVIAVDTAGNETRLTQSMMGGVDLRGLPWPAIGVVVVLVAVFLSSIRGVRGGSRQVRPIAVDATDESVTVIEELSMGRIDRRD